MKNLTALTSSTHPAGSALQRFNPATALAVLTVLTLLTLLMLAAPAQADAQRQQADPDSLSITAETLKKIEKLLRLR